MEERKMNTFTFISLQKVLHTLKLKRMMQLIKWRYLLPLFIFFFLAQPVHLRAQEIRQIHAGSGLIPDIANGGNITLNAAQMINVVVLGDGYIVDSSSGVDEKEDFFTDARYWYNYRIFDLIRPFNTDFKQAFRIYAVFNPSDDHASQDRTSYYKVKVTCNGSCSVDKGGWHNGSGSDDLDFRNRVFGAIDDVDAVHTLNMAAYPGSLNASRFAGVYRNIVVAILVRGYKDSAKTRVDNLSGFADTVVATSGSLAPRVRTAVGKGYQHEFGHAFAYLSDEYIDGRGTTASGSNPLPSQRSVFNISNLTFSNDRCDLLWPHLAPGGRYNPNMHSLIGNLFKGGGRENGVWHSEYTCLMNGGHTNYFCNDTETGIGTEAYIRDHYHLCFRCEEIVMVRILEKTGQLGSEIPSNETGRTWYNRWVNSLRHNYYTRFDIPTEIARKDACYNYMSGKPCPAEFPQCYDACEDVYLNVNRQPYRPSCIHECNIRETGNAIYVYSGAGAGQDGSRKNPYNDIPTAINISQSVCSYPHLIVIKPGSYPDPMTYDIESTWISDGCSTVGIGD
jgi:hypothetical protein